MEVDEVGAWFKMRGRVPRPASRLEDPCTQLTHTIVDIRARTTSSSSERHEHNTISRTQMISEQVRLNTPRIGPLTPRLYNGHPTFETAPSVLGVSCRRYNSTVAMQPFLSPVEVKV
jgi:hypothetical protein